MTPTQTYAAKRAEAESLIRQHAPARLQNPLIALLRPAIALHATRADDAQIPLGASKFGGAPDVPDGFEWPMWNGEPLGFLAQINLEEVAPFDVEGVLPKSGVLSFFQGGSLWHSEKSKHHISLMKSTELTLMPAPPALHKDNSWNIPLCRVMPNARWVLPDMGALDWFDSSLKGEEFWDDIDPLYNALAQPTEHRLLGYANSIQDPVELEAQMQATSRRSFGCELQVEMEQGALE